MYLVPGYDGVQIQIHKAWEVSINDFILSTQGNVVLNLRISLKMDRFCLSFYCENSSLGRSIMGVWVWVTHSNSKWFDRSILHSLTGIPKLNARSCRSCQYSCSWSSDYKLRSGIHGSRANRQIWPGRALKWCPVGHNAELIAGVRAQGTCCIPVGAAAAVDAMAAAAAAAKLPRQL